MTPPPKSHDRALIILVALALALMAGIVVKAVRRPEPQAADVASRAAAGSPSGVPLRPTVYIERRRVPTLTLDQVRAAGLSLREAMYYEKLPGRKVQCRLCPIMCVLADGERGQCRTRINLGGVLRTLVYGRLVAVHADPIEKKPLFHYLPGTRAFSIATAGCNLGCVFCQNWQISQALPERARNLFVTPEQVIAAAKRANCRTIAYTYTEPSIFYEFMLDTARLARQHGLRNIWITCGYINPDPLRELCKVMDAANVDLKGFDEDFYRTYCKASLEPVLTTLKISREEGVWIEVTNLLIPGANDDPDTIRDLCKWHIANLGPGVPIHFSRFHPDYQMLDKPPTPVSTLKMAARIAKEEGIHHIYLGNVATRTGDDTFCPNCGRLLIQRQGYTLLQNLITRNQCPHCATEIPGVWTLPPLPPAP